MKQKLSIFKIGGNIIEDQEKLNQFLRDFSSVPGKKILIHGGGKMANQLSEKIGIQPQMHQGRRITDEATMDVVTMVYAGLINKKIVAQLQANSCNALGLSGADANVICGKKRPVKDIDYGLAGDIDAKGVDLLKLEQLLCMDLTLVFSAITHNGAGQLLNTNADTIASTLAVALASIFVVDLIFCFEKKGVLKDIKDENSVIFKIDKVIFEKLRAQKIIFEGMLPKIENAVHAVEKGVKAVIIGSADELEALYQGTAGTRITL